MSLASTVQWSQHQSPASESQQLLSGDEVRSNSQQLPADSTTQHGDMTATTTGEMVERVTRMTHLMVVFMTFFVYGEFDNGMTENDYKSYHMLVYHMQMCILAFRIHHYLPIYSRVFLNQHMYDKKNMYAFALFI